MDAFFLGFFSNQPKGAPPKRHPLCVCVCVFVDLAIPADGSCMWDFSQICPSVRFPAVNLGLRSSVRVDSRLPGSVLSRQWLTMDAVSWRPKTSAPPKTGVDLPVFPAWRSPSRASKTSAMLWCPVRIGSCSMSAPPLFIKKSAGSVCSSKQVSL